MSAPQPSPAPALRVEGLRKTYANGVEALCGVSLTVEAGDFFALLGPNGAGKSTLIGIVCSLVRPGGGRVEVFGIDALREREAALALIGLVPQELNFNQFETPFEIVRNYAGFFGIPRREAEARAERWLRELKLWERAHQPSRALSGGMKRRLLIARALVTGPRLLILDEPTAGVDIEIRRSLWEFLRRINGEGITVILTTHYLEEAEQLCRNVAIIDRGRIIEHTSVKTLLAKLDVETFVLDLEAPLAAPPALSERLALRLTDPRTLEVEVPKAKPLNQVFADLSAQGIRVVSLRNKANRLEELFLRLVDGGASRAA
ncbi:MAG: ABC transporter ATP-binding protein [Xanthomonadales bacterium]|nr:ABC transporter ATP-binding protein [Xanthomonadales bacterium]